MNKNQQFSEIVRNNSERIFGLFMKMTGNHDEADELTQRTFLKVYNNLESFRGDAALSTWIYRIAINIGKNYLRKKKARKFIGLDKIMDLARNDSNINNMNNMKYKLQKAIEKLSPKQNMVVLLRGYQGLPYKKIGAIMGISENSAKVNFSHALNNLEKYLSKMGVNYEDM
ncbi:MAG: RNA polymerase sigma factor [Candidatus Marinimicrobia bacterium]|nr:RNA polymerase sigma factor [Candidatus Neomarinimicrobiota bacterium]